MEKKPEYWKTLHINYTTWTMLLLHGYEKQEQLNVSYPCVTIIPVSITSVIKSALYDFICTFRRNC